MTKCVVGRWRDTLDEEDVAAFEDALRRLSRADLYALICVAHGGRPFGLTAFKDCLNGRCVCDVNE